MTSETEYRPTVPGELPVMRRADCGHGWVSMDTPPSGISSGQGEMLYFCVNCRRQRSLPETKIIPNHRKARR